MTYFVKENFLGGISHDLLTLLSTKTEYRRERQYAPDFYQNEDQASKEPGWPDKTEPYMALFQKAVPEILEHDLIKEFIEKISLKLEFEHIGSPLIYRLSVGDGFRCHKDGYLGNFGYTYFLNQNWRWDWGGILTMIDDEGIATALLPTHDSLIARRESLHPNLHFVNPVNTWASNPQYLILGFGNR